MSFRKLITSGQQVSQLDMVLYLSSLGFQPSKICNWNYWYFSPLRDEHTPSFKVNRKINRWYDHSMGKGGNLIDFAILYNNCTVGELLHTISSMVPDQYATGEPIKSETPGKNVSIQIIKAGPLRSYSLLRYLQQRRLPFKLANQYLKEVTYQISGHPYCGIGFKNNSGGYEISSPLMKCSSAPKDITIIKKGGKLLSVFEGFFDFLSFLFINQSPGLLQTNFLVLNSIAFFEKAHPLMESYPMIHLYLDRDRTGQNCSRYAASLSNQYMDQSNIYRNYKDLNDWLINIGKAQPCIAK